MRAVSIAILVLGLALGGCNKADEAEYGTNPKPQGRYAGIGTFDAGRMWSQAAGAAAPKDPAAAKLEDDEHVIVVVDTRTGEVRQCGDHSGVCVAMNPWSGPGGLTAPVALKKHAAELDAEQQEREAVAPEANTASAH
jgi:hypothetical protein